MVVRRSSGFDNPTHVLQTDESIWAPAASFGAASGSPALALSGGGRWRTMLFDAASTEIAVVAVDLPAYVENVQVDLFWTNQGAGSGDVVWLIHLDGALDGATLSATGGIATGVEVTVTAPAQDVLKVSSLQTVSGVDASKLMNLRLARIGGSASDTLANDAAVLGVRVLPF